MIIHRQINSCSTNMNVVNNELPAFKEKNKQRTPEGSKNPQRTCILLFLIKSGEVSLAAGLFLKGWADEKSHLPSLKQRLVEYLFLLWTSDLCKAVLPQLYSL